MKYTLYILLVLISASAYAQEAGSVLVKNGTVITVTKGTLENTDVLITDGKIAKVGKNLKAASGVKTIDATGQFVMPGIIDAHSHIALDAVNEATDPSTAHVWVGDALDPFDVGIYRALAGGVTTSHAMHGSANAIGGQCETIKHRYGEVEPNNLRMVGAPRTIKFALGLILLGVGFLVMVSAAQIAASGAKAGMIFLILTYFFHSIGELFLSPVGLSSMTKLSPKRFAGQMMGLWFVATALGNLIAGTFAGNFDPSNVGEMPDLFWVFVKLPIGVALIFFALSPIAKKWMREIH